MVIGVETVGLVLAVLPLLVNQLDNYTRGIQQIKLLRRYHRTLADYTLKLRTQHTIFLNNLEQALDGVVHDDDQIRDLINDPDGDPWKDPVLQQNLLRKLDRNYEYFLENMSSLHSMILHLAKKLDLDLANQMNTSIPSKKDIIILIKVMQKAVYDDLLQRIRDVNDVLKTLIEQSGQTKTIRERRSPWRQLLTHFRVVRKNAEGIFQAVVHGSHWSCPCRDSHSAHLQVRSDPLAENAKYSNGLKVRVTFSTSAIQNTTCTWGWSEVEFETCEQDQRLSVANLTLNGDQSSTNGRASRVRFKDTPATTERAIETADCRTSVETLIGDMCSVFSGRVKQTPTLDGVAYLISKPHLKMRYKMRPVRCSQQAVPLRTLHEALPASNRRDRLYIAAGLACSVIQYHGNWLKPQWSCCDIHLPTEYNGDADTPPENLYISWPLESQLLPLDHINNSSTPLIRNHILFPLALALTELSLGKTLVSLQVPEDDKGDIASTQFHTALRLLSKVYRESGSNYHDAVHTCLFWPSVDGPCFGNEHFEEKVFSAVVAPLLRDLVHFYDPTRGAPG